MKRKSLPAKRPITDDLIQRTDKFLANPLEMTDFKSLRVYFSRVADCILRAEIDKTFQFSTKAANTLTYVGALVIQAMIQEKNSGGTGGLEERYKSLAAQVAGMSLTPQQAAMLLKAQELSVQINVLEKIVAENTEYIIEEVTDVMPVTPATRRIAAINKTAKELDEDEYAF
jgi:hypothetical protein